MTEFTEFSEKYLEAFRKLLDEININALEKIVDILIETHHSGGRIFCIGNGGSASTASHLACDLTKGSSVYAVSLTDNVATVTAISNDISYDDIFKEQLSYHRLGHADALVAISVSGNSKNIIKAVEYANGVGAKTIGMSGFSGGQLKKMAKINLVLSNHDYGHVESAHGLLAHLIPIFMRGRV